MAKDFRRIPVNRLHWYNATDCLTTLDVSEMQRGLIGTFLPAWRMLWQPAMDALGQVERWGALLGVDNVQAYDAILTRQIEDKRLQLADRHGLPEDFNPRSSPHMQELLFAKLGLKPVATTRTGQPSMCEEALVTMAERNPSKTALLNDIIAFRADLSARSRSGANLLKYVGYDGRVHTHFKVIRSFRISSSEPNLQNMKSQEDDADDDPGKLARGCWVAPPGYVVLALDYGQNELRFAAALAGDEAMAAALDSSDFHRATAVGIFGTEDIAKWQRRVGKEVNFGLVFGQSDFGLWQKLNGLPAEARNNQTFTQAQCKTFQDGLFKAYPKLGKWLRSRVREGYETGQSVAKWGPIMHRRQLPAMGLPDTKQYRKVRRHAENVCRNNPIQCVANIPGLSSLTRCVEWILEEDVPAELVLPVHDSNVFYVREDAWRDVARGARDRMLDFDFGIVKPKVDIEMGERDYGHMRPVSDL